MPFMRPDADDIRVLMMNGFDQAFMAQIGKLYQIYLSNAVTGGGDPTGSTKRGIENAIEAYKKAVEAVNNWSE